MYSPGHIVRSNKAIKHVRQAALDSQQVARHLWRRYIAGATLNVIA